MSFLANRTSQDPTLVSLFEGSSGPVVVPQVARISQTKAKPNENEEISETSTSSSDNEDSAEVFNDRPRKRRRVHEEHEDLEAAYLNQLAKEEAKEEDTLLKARRKQVTGSETQDGESSDLDSSASEEERGIEDDDDINEHETPKHEALDGQSLSNETEKTARTVFLGNVSTNVIKTKQGKRALISHLQTVLDPKMREKVESIRFRSTAFVSDAGPKKAAFAKKELMEETTKSTNAYVILSTEAAARKVASRLNGSIVLDRHLRADYLGNPSKTDHRRCVFVGNLSFVDEATITEESKEGNTKRRKAKEPADVEEGLWRTFSKVGKVESVRVVRDKETRISKGFAYVQFEDQNGVEKALLLNEKKFPPLLPRILRVMRAKQLKPSRDRSNGPKRNSRMNGKYGSQNNQVTNNRGMAGNVVFEGHRASSNSTTKAAKVRKRHAVKPTTRSSRRGAAFKASGGKKK